MSPDFGWDTLSNFLADVTDHLQIAMYDFSAPHLYSALKKVLRDGASMNFVYDGKKAAHVGSGTKVDDKTEEEILKGLEKIAGQGLTQYQLG